MTRLTVLLGVVVTSSLAAVLLQRPGDALAGSPTGDERPTCEPAPAPRMRRVSEGRATGAPGPIDGVYFPGGARQLTLSRGRFLLADAEVTPTGAVEGRFSVDEDVVTFASLSLSVKCRWEAKAGLLVLSDLGDEGIACRDLLGPRWPERPWARAVGPVGLTPFRAASGVGFWVDEAGRRTQIIDGPEPLRDVFAPSAHGPLHWDPDGSGVVVEHFSMHIMNHLDTPLR